MFRCKNIKNFCKATKFQYELHEGFPISTMEKLNALEVYVKFCETQNGSPTRYSGSETKIFRRKILMLSSSLIHKLLRYRKFSETQHRRFIYEVFRYCETKNFRRKKLIPPPPLIHKPFRYLELVKHEKAPQRNFSKRWDKKISTEKIDPRCPPPSSPKFSGTRN